MWTKMIMRKKCILLKEGGDVIVFSLLVKSNGCMFFQMFKNIGERPIFGCLVSCCVCGLKEKQGRTGSILILLEKTKGFFDVSLRSTLTRVILNLKKKKKVRVHLILFFFFMKHCMPVDAFSYCLYMIAKYLQRMGKKNKK